MTTLTLIFIGLALLLYVILGGADFGAGIIEILTGKKGINTISKAIAPVWEANHIWIIVVIVILFNAFPEAYSTVMLYLHIPVMLVLVGIIFRGTAFTFRYYDPFQDRSHAVYTFIFKLFSLFTPFFLGVTLGAVILGRITLNSEGTYFERFVAPWLSWFNVALGIFVVILFAYLAAVYLAGEPAENGVKKQFSKYTQILLGALVLSGLLVFGAAEISGLTLFSDYLHSWISIASIVIATLLVPVLLIALKKEYWNLSRITAGAQTTSIIVGWFGVHLPDLIMIKDAMPLTVQNTIAPDATLRMMIIALIVGLALVIPLLLYLFKVFKFDKGEVS